MAFVAAFVFVSFAPAEGGESGAEAAALRAAVESAVAFGGGAQSANNCVELEWRLSAGATCNAPNQRNVDQYFRFYNRCDYTIMVRWHHNGSGRSVREVDDRVRERGGSRAARIIPGGYETDFITCPSGEPYVTYCAGDYDRSECRRWDPGRYPFAR